MLERLAIANRYVNSSSLSQSCLAPAKVARMTKQTGWEPRYLYRQEFLRWLVKKERSIEDRGAQRRVAEKLGMDPSHFSQIVTGHRKCGEDVALKIAEKLNISIEDMSRDRKAIGIDIAVEQCSALPGQSQPKELVPVSSFDWSSIPPAARALVETVVKKSSDGELSDADLALLLSTVSRLSSKE